MLRVDPRRHRTGVGVRIVPEGLADGRPLTLRPPRYASFDASAAVRAWVAAPASNKGIRIEESGGVDFRTATLEVSHAGTAARPIAPVTGLQAVHQSGQTFLTWREIEDPVGDDGPAFADFEKSV